MFKKALIFLPLLFGSPAALAITCASEISARRGESRVGEATCKNCRSVNDFARFGASVLYDNHQAAIKNVGYPRFNRVLVKSGSRAVTVTIDRVLLDTPFSLGEFGINYGIRQQHRGVVAVNATPYRGNVVGSPWTWAQVQISELTKLCKAIKLEKEKLTNPLLSKEIERSIHASEAYASSMGPVFLSNYKYGWESILQYFSITGFGRGGIPIVTQTEYAPGQPVDIPTFNVYENYY
jgi:hypothetical protein